MKPLSQRKLCFLTIVSAFLGVLGMSPSFAAVEHGSASWYSVRTNGGTQTASGQSLKDGAATAAHKTLPLGSKVKVTNLANGRSQTVTITDRGPYIAGRIIDVTIGTAERLGFVDRGVTPVKVETVGRSSTVESSERSSNESRSSERSRVFRGDRGDRSASRSNSESRRSTAWTLFTGPRRSF